MTLHLYIELEGSSPLVWRRITVPASYTFYRLHLVLQAVFGWENAHLFQFCSTGLTDPTGYGIPDDGETGVDITDARRARISKTFRRPGDEYRYVYDFGDYWKHKIQLEKVEEEDGGGPICTAGNGACPPEDVGGMHGYWAMLEVLARGGEEAEEYRTWLGLGAGEQWDAGFCSVRESNKRVRMVP